MSDETLIWVTGASQGIGKALIQAVPWQGARVIGVSRSPGPALVHLAADLADPAGWDMLEASFHRELAGLSGGRAVFLHAAATIGPIGFAGETDPRRYRASVLLNAAAPLILGEAFLRAGQHSRCRRQLVLLSSGAARRPYPGVAAYGAAKAAVDQWVKAAGREQARRGQVQVLAINPGRVATAMHEQLRAAGDDQLPDHPEFIRLDGEGLLSDPRDVARQLWSLLDDQNITSGQVLNLADYPTTKTRQQSR
jgi:NAD(P)-dependent dehydrogenase (short-subunit alcohol dehydrogenase family)